MKVKALLVKLAAVGVFCLAAPAESHAQVVGQGVYYPAQPRFMGSYRPTYIYPMSGSVTYPPMSMPYAMPSGAPLTGSFQTPAGSYPTYTVPTTGTMYTQPLTNGNIVMMGSPAMTYYPATGTYPTPCALAATGPQPTAPVTIPGAMPVVRSDAPSKLIHLQFALYELREAKEDVRELSAVPEKERKDILGGIDSGIEQLKKTIEACGGKPEWIKPTQRLEFSNFHHLRHALASMKTAKDQIKTQEGLADEARTTAINEINKIIVSIEKAIDAK